MSHAASSLNGQEGSGPPHLHHMDSATAYGAAKLGMWLFLATEILLFAVLFVSFALFRWQYLEEFHHASKHLDWRMGAFNTVVLLFSSFTAALAVDFGKRGQNKRIVQCLAVTIVCGFIFLIVKYMEYSAKYHHGLFPTNPEFNSPEFTKEYKSFFGLYYCMTGLHALHVVIGMAILTWVMLKARRGRFSSSYSTPVELGALYWHLVDLIWIYLFPLLYLVG